MQSYLKTREDTFIGLIAHSHCSHTPCATCATSFSREREERGILNQIANGKPVFVLCSCQNHYERKPPMLQYEQTTYCQGTEPSRVFKDQLEDPSCFSIAAAVPPVFSPYPVVLLKFDPARNLFVFEREKVIDMARESKK